MFFQIDFQRFKNFSLQTYCTLTFALNWGMEISITISDLSLSKTPAGDLFVLTRGQREAACQPAARGHPNQHHQPWDLHQQDRESLSPRG
jgi:hypothetical protein